MGASLKRTWGVSQTHARSVFFIFVSFLSLLKVDLSKLHPGAVYDYHGTGTIRPKIFGRKSAIRNPFKINAAQRRQGPIFARFSCMGLLRVRPAIFCWVNRLLNGL